MLEKAILIAVKAHFGQKDKAGQPYICHPLRVMLSLKSEEEKICAVLHDVIEDTDINLDYLRKEGFSEEILEILDLLTKREDEIYTDFINRIMKNKTASTVKLADLYDNMDISRIPNPTQEDLNRIQKYQKAINDITIALHKYNEHC